MAIKIERETESWGIACAMMRVERDWPDLSLFEWVKQPTDFKQALWVAHWARWWHVWDDTQYLGYVAATDSGKGRWSFHFGAVAGIDHARVMPRAWRLFLREAASEGVRIVAVYIPTERPEIRRLARIFKLRRFSKTLWALNLNLHQNLSRLPKRHLK